MRRKEGISSKNLSCRVERVCANILAGGSRPVHILIYIDVYRDTNQDSFMFLVQITFAAIYAVSYEIST